VYVAAQAADTRWLADAIQILDPAAAIDETTGTNVLTELKEEFSLDTAQRLAALAPSDSTRRQAVELLIQWATSQYIWSSEVDKLRRVADDLLLTPEAAERGYRWGGEDQAGFGDHWRAFLTANAAGAGAG